MKSEYTDLFDMFNLPPSAEQDQIQKAVRTKIIENHPDNADITITEFKSLKHAADILLDEQSRQRYVQSGHNSYVMSNMDGQLDGFTFSGTREFEPQATPSDVSTTELLENNYEQMTSGLARLDINKELDVEDSRFTEQTIDESSEQITRGESNTTGSTAPPKTQESNPGAAADQKGSVISSSVVRLFILLLVASVVGLGLTIVGAL